MKPNLIFSPLVFPLFIFVCAARAAEPGSVSNPYLVIAEHNVFKLVPPHQPAAANAVMPPPDIALNGIMTVFGKKIALLKTRSRKGESFMLAEGQDHGEIQLLSVDGKAGEIKVNNHGVIQTIALSKTFAASTALFAGAVPAVDADKNFQSAPAGAFSMDGVENHNVAARPVSQTGFAVANGNSQAGPPGNNPPPDGAGTMQNSGGSNYEPWQTVAARNMEAARTATADLVARGGMQPYPLTPLTPAGTPANLVGEGQLYFANSVQ
jgi:hypothetical protein